MSFKRWFLIGAVVALFVFAKAWILTHPKSMIGIVVGALLLIITEPTEAK
jgi:hypothetical protein